jgi:hypothetical protein
MAEEIEEQEPDIQVEVVPEPEDEKPRLKGGDTRTLDVRDDEIKGYGREVQDRIKKLRFAFHEERRQKEQKERDLVSATDYAQRLHRENQDLKKNVHRTEQAVVHQAMSRVDAEIISARQQNRQALEAGQADQIVDAGEKLARAVAERERLALLQSTGTEEQEPPPPPQQQPPPDRRTQDWFARNTWFRQPGQEVRTHVAQAAHEQLAARGVSATNNPDLYWKTIDSKIAEFFPEHASNGNGNGSNMDRQDDDEREATGSRPLAVAGGTRSNTGAAGNAGRTRVIRLSESQVRLARRIGVTPEQYAHQLALEQGGRANG